MTSKQAASRLAEAMQGTHSGWFHKVTPLYQPKKTEPKTQSFLFNFSFDNAENERMLDEFKSDLMLGRV